MQSYLSWQNIYIPPENRRMSDFKVIKVDRFYSKAVKDGFDDIVRQIFNNRV